MNEAEMIESIRVVLYDYLDTNNGSAVVGKIEILCNFEPKNPDGKISITAHHRPNLYELSRTEPVTGDKNE